MKIGVGVTTIDQTRLSRFMEAFALHSPGLDIFVYEDSERKGVRHSKNECLKALKGCDYIFLFDDDCYPIKKDWHLFLIPLLDKWNHLCFNLAEIHGKKAILEDILITHNCGGVFLAYTKKVIDIVGFIDNRYTGHGWEHLGYSYRIFRSALTINPYLSPVGIENYLYAEDYVNPKNREFTEAERKMRDKNELVFIEEASNLNPKYVR